RTMDWERARVQEPEVIYDEERNVFRMWYVAYPQLQAGEARQNIGRIAYAESEDGVSWYRPELLDYPWNGSPSNIVFERGQSVHGFSIIPNPDASMQPERKYLAV